MSREDWAFPIPKEMRCTTYTDDTWEDNSHISIDSDDAFMLGFDVPWKMSRKEASPTPPPTSPPPAPAPSPCHTPMMNHYTTFYKTSTAEIPAGHTAPTPGSSLGLTPYALPPRSLDDQQFDRWINSQASIVDHPKVQEHRSNEIRGRTLSFSNPIEHSSAMPPLEPDSADTTFSSNGPGTPPPPPAFRDINHYNGDPFALADEAFLPLSHPSHPDRTLGTAEEGDIASNILTSITHTADKPASVLSPSHVSASTLHVEVEDLTPTLDNSTKRKSKRQRRTHTPVPSSPRPDKPSKRAKKVSAPEQPLHDIFTIDPADSASRAAEPTGLIDQSWAGEGEQRARYGFVMPDNPGPIPLPAASAEIESAGKEGSSQDQRGPLDVLASVAARRRQTESPVRALHGGEGDRQDDSGDDALKGDLEGGLDVDNKAWLLDQLDHKPPGLSLTFDIQAESTTPTNFAPLDPVIPAKDEHQPFIPSSAIPGSKLHSPAKSSTSDETNGSETTPTLDSRTKRRNEREYRRLRRIGIMTDEKADPAEEFSPGPEARGRIAASRRNGLEKTDDIGTELKDDDEENDMPRCLLSFSKRAKSLQARSASVASDKSGVLSRFSTVTEESAFGTTSPSAKEAMERAQAKKTVPGSSTRAVQRKKGFNAPRPIAKTDSQVSQASVGGSENMDEKKDDGKKRKLDLVEDEGHEEDMTETKKVKLAPDQTRLPLATVSNSTNNNFTSISESAKLRRAKTAGPSLLPTLPVSTISRRQGSVAASAKGKKRGGKIQLASATPQRSATASGSVQPKVIEKKQVPDEDDEADYVEQPLEFKPKKKSGQHRKQISDVIEEAGGEEGDGRKTPKNYSEAEMLIMLDSWDGESSLSNAVIDQCIQDLVDAGHSLRTRNAIKWYLKNTLWPRFSEKYDLPLIRSASGQGKGGRSRS